MDKIKYKKLPGKHNNVVSFSTLWLGPDHILFCESTRFSEAYKRFYFSDIQSLVIRKTIRAKIIDIVTISLTALLVLLWLFLWREMYILFGILIGPYILIFIINHIKGPTCVTHIQTAVQIENLRPLNRVKKAEKFFETIIPPVTSAQGELAPEMVEEKYEQHSAEKHVPSAKQFQKDRKTLGLKGSLLHTSLFALLILDGQITLVDYYINNFAITLITSALFIPLSILPIIAVVKQSGMNIKRSIRNITWCIIGYLCIGIICSYILLVMVSMSFIDEGRVMNNFELMRLFSKMSPDDNVFLKGVYLFSIFSSFTLGILGLLLSTQPKKSKIQ